MSLKQGHLKASNHLSFSVLLYLHESHTSQASLLWAVWLKARAQSDMVPSSSLSWSSLSVFLLCSAQVKILSDLYNFLDAHANPHGATSHLHVAHRHTSFKHTTHVIYVALPLGNKLHPVYFRKYVYFLLCHPHNLSVCQRDLPVNIQITWIPTNLIFYM